MPKQVYLSCG